MRNNWTITKDLFLSADEVNSLYVALSDAKDLALQRKKFYVHVRDYFLLRTLLETGLRVFELVSLRVGDLHGNSLIVRKGKGGKCRNVLLTNGTQKMIRNFIRIKQRVLKESTSELDFLFVSERRRPYSTRGVRRRVKFWFGKCGFSQKFSCHSCRHTYVSHLLAAGIDTVTVRDNAGHSSLAITSIYGHVVKDDLGDFEVYKSGFVGRRTNSKAGDGKDQ